MVLLQIIPFLIYDFIIDDTDTTWEWLLNLRKISNLVLSTKLHISQVAYLQTLVQEYIYSRNILFAELPLRPQHHYMLHYAKLIHFGPLRLLWTLRKQAQIFQKYYKTLIKF